MCGIAGICGPEALRHLPTNCPKATAFGCHVPRRDRVIQASRPARYPVRVRSVISTEKQPETGIVRLGQCSGWRVRPTRHVSLAGPPGCGHHLAAIRICETPSLTARVSALHAAKHDWMGGVFYESLWMRERMMRDDLRQGGRL